jgi:hypothetical protein
VAASSQEQSASTQEIAAAAATLATAADRLSKLVANLRLGEESAAPTMRVESSSVAPARIAPASGEAILRRAS